MYKTVPFQIFNSNAKNNSFQLVRTAFHSSSFFFFFSKIAGFFFKVRGARSLVSPLERSRRTQLYGLQSSLKICSKIWATFISKANSQLKRRRYD